MCVQVAIFSSNVRINFAKNYIWNKFFHENYENKIKKTNFFFNRWTDFEKNILEYNNVIIKKI